MPQLEAALEKLNDSTSEVAPVSPSEFRDRLNRLQELMKERGCGAVYLHGGTNLYYFTGLRWSPSERLVGALIPAEGEPVYVAPQFELNTLQDYWLIEGEIFPWEEHESPFRVVKDVLSKWNVEPAEILLDESTPFFIVDHLQQELDDTKLGSAQPITVACRQQKSETEIEIIRKAHQMTSEVILAARSILQPGITTAEVADFIDAAHRKVGAAGSFFCIVLFGKATSFPHGVKDPQTLQDNDWVLIDTGCLLHGYNSDITRTFAFGQPTEKQQQIWDLEKAAQLAAFEAAQNGSACEQVDSAARQVLEQAGLGPDYKVPGLPHRTGHGCGLDIHEAPYIVKGNATPLKKGMVASIEPMIVVPDEFGCRLEDHFYMTDNGPEWFTRPAPSMDELF